MIDWKLRVWCFLVDYCFERTIFICIKRLLGLLCVLTIIEGFGWVVIWLFGIDDLIIWVLLGKWTFVFFQVLFCFCCEHWKSNLLTFRAFEVLKKTVGNDLLMHDYLYWFLKEIENCIDINSDCIWFGNRPLSPIARIHWIKRLHFCISLHSLGQSHITWVSLPLPLSKQQPFKKNFA